MPLLATLPHPYFIFPFLVFLLENQIPPYKLAATDLPSLHAICSQNKAQEY